MLGWSKDPENRPMGRVHDAARARGDTGRGGGRPPRLLTSVLTLPLLAITVAAVLALAVWVTGDHDPGPPTANPPGSFSFAALGDSPYYLWENGRYRGVLEDMGAHELSAVVHVGDLFETPCTRDRYQRSLIEFNSLPHPVIYTPGDNEWTDCWSHGGFQPLDRLAQIREIFFDDPGHSLGGRQIALDFQGAQEKFADYVENARWTHENVVFATLHLVGSWNGMNSFPDRTAADDLESKQRTEAATAWMRETFAEAKARGAPAVVLAFHGNPLFEEPADDSYRMSFEPFVEALEQEVQAFGLPVLGIHGDWHEYTVDRPLARRSDGLPLDNFTRLQVPGSPDIGWVRVIVTPNAAEPFTFEPRVIPFWR